MVFKRYQINRRVIADLKHRSTIGMYFYMVVTICVLAVDGFYKRHVPFAIFFISAMFFIAGFRIFHHFMFEKISKIPRRINNGIFFTSVYATALIWGVGFAYFMVQPEELSSQIIMIASTVGLNSGGVVAFIPSWRTSALYSLSMMSPAAVIMAYLGIHPTLVFLIALFILYMMMIALRGNHEYWDALENEHLLELKTKEIEKISRLDVLTGLYNRRYFDEIFNIFWKTAIRNSTLITIIIADIDLFKPINDTYGHLAGDAYLKKVAAVFEGIFQRDTDFVARYGGEEFVFLLERLDSKGAIELAEKVRTEIKNMILRHYNHRIQTTLSMGIASCIPEPGDKKENFFKKADNALYQAKNNGRDQIIYFGKNTRDKTNVSVSSV